MTWEEILQWFSWATNPGWWALGLSVIALCLALVAWRRTRLPRISFETETGEGFDGEAFMLRNVGSRPVTNVEFVLDPTAIAEDATGNPSLIVAAFRKPKFEDDTLADPPRLMPKQSGRFVLPGPIEDWNAPRKRSRVLVTCDQSKAIFSVELATPGRSSAPSTRCARNMTELYAPWSTILEQSFHLLGPTLEKLLEKITDLPEPELIAE